MSEEKDAQQPVQVPMAKLDVYAHLLTYDDSSTIDTKVVGELAKVSPKSVASMIGQLKTNSEVYLQLLAAGYVDEQVPEWVLRPAEGVAGLVEGAKVSGGVLAMPNKTQKTPALEKDSLQPANLDTDTAATTATIVDHLRDQGRPLSAAELAGLDTGQLTQHSLNKTPDRLYIRVVPREGGTYTKIHNVSTEPT